MPIRGFVRAMGTVAMENSGKTIVPMVKAKNTCLSFIFVFKNLPKIIEGTLLKLLGSPAIIII